MLLGSDRSGGLGHSEVVIQPSHLDPNGKGSLEFVRQRCVLYGHVLEFTGLEDFAAFEAFHEFSVFFPGHDLHARMLALSHLISSRGVWGNDLNHT